MRQSIMEGPTGKIAERPVGLRLAPQRGSFANLADGFDLRVK